MLTNWSTVQKQIERLKVLEQEEKDGIFESFSKKILVKNEKKLKN